ncbi:CBS domain-containing protein [Marinobacteraceae bacterium S3BR75-40.1]
MSKPAVTRDIMITNVITCHEDDTLGLARKLMKDHNIRHIPVVDKDSGDFIGLVTQKAVLREMMIVADHFGMDDLERQEKKKKVGELMETGVETIQPQLSLLEAGQYFIDCKHGCLPVLEGGKIVGILTSADFVKLSVALLK